MIQINNTEKEYLVEHGLWYGEGGISRTFTHCPKYYMCESGKNKNLLKKYYQEVGLDPNDVDRRCGVKKGR